MTATEIQLSPLAETLKPRDESPLPLASFEVRDLENSQVPIHVAIIMDGNGRWAHQRGLGRHAGHRAGTENIQRVIERLCEHGVRYLTLFAFSTENWRRPAREVQGLMRLPSFYLR